MASYGFCDAVLNALGRDSYPADCGTANCPQRCARPDASGNCPPSAAIMAQKTDLLRGADSATRGALLAQLEAASSDLWTQYGINASAVSWEDIAEQCRDPSGHKRSRQFLASLGYNARARPLLFSRGSGGDEHAWLGKLEGARVGGEFGDSFAEFVDPFVPLVADRLLPPVLSFIIGALFILILVVVLVLAMRRLSQPDRVVIVRRQGGVPVS